MNEELFSNVGGRLVPRYPDAAGFKREGTSKQSADSIRDVSKAQERCLNSIQFKPGTADEIAERICASILFVRPRISELVAKNKVKDSGLRRLNASGKSAVVWVAI